MSAADHSQLERYEGVATIEKVAALARRRGFVYPSSDIYGGLGSSYDYGHYGVLLKQNVKDEWQRSMIQERTTAGLAAARARGRIGGRPPALSAADLAAAKALLRDPGITVEQVAKRLGVSPSTLYKHLPGGRGAVDV